jgi:hypothetical protein
LYSSLLYLILLSHAEDHIICVRFIFYQYTHNWSNGVNVCVLLMYLRACLTRFFVCPHLILTEIYSPQLLCITHPLYASYFLQNVCSFLFLSF